MIVNNKMNTDTSHDNRFFLYLAAYSHHAYFFIHIHTVNLHKNFITRINNKIKSNRNGNRYAYTYICG